MGLFTDNQSTTTGSTSQNWSPGMQNILGYGQSAFNSGRAWSPYTNPLVSPMATQTTQGLQGIQRTAQGQIPAINQNFQRVNATLAQGGWDPAQQQGADWLQKIASGGEMQNNPYLEGVISRGSEDIANSANLMASAGGRLGSGSHANVLQKNIGQFAGDLRFQDYGNQQQRRDAAIRDYFNAGQTRRDNVFAGTNALAGASQLQFDPYKMMGQVGSAYENLNNRQLADQQRIFQEGQRAQTAPIEWLSNLAHGYGGTTEQKMGSNGSTFGNALGGALTGYDVFGGPYGAIAGALQGALR